MIFNILLTRLGKIRQRWADHKRNSGKGTYFAQLLDAAQEERSRLWENPPPCGSVIRYVHDSIYDETYGEFLFSANDIEHELEGIIKMLPNLAQDDERAILNWVKHRDESLAEPTDVPSTWSRFKYVANYLARAGKADIYCMHCKAGYKIDQCGTKDDQGKPGYNFDHLRCPEGHLLLMVDTVHLQMR